VAAVNDRRAQLERWRDAMQVSELKMLVARELLASRREHAALMSVGEYERLMVVGEHAGQVLAFRRWESGGDEAIVLVGRCTASIGSRPVGGPWGNTRLNLGGHRARAWRCLLHGTRIADVARDVQIGDVFSVLPVAVLVPDRMSSYELVS